jgi:hypothetical protein
MILLNKYICDLEHAMNGIDLVEDEVWLRELTFSEEERLSLTTAPWNGERRWFRSPNIVPLERYRGPEEMARIIGVLRARRTTCTGSVA